MPRPKNPNRVAHRYNLELTAADKERIERLVVALNARSMTEVISRSLTLTETLVNLSKDGVVKLDDKLLVIGS
jgi:hypothetical protein